MWSLSHYREKNTRNQGRKRHLPLNSNPSKIWNIVDKVQWNQYLTFASSTPFQHHLMGYHKNCFIAGHYRAFSFSSAPQVCFSHWTPACACMKYWDWKSASFHVMMLHQAPSATEFAWNTIVLLYEAPDTEWEDCHQHRWSDSKLHSWA